MQLNSPAIRILILSSITLLFLLFFGSERYLSFILTTKYFFYLAVTLLAIILLAKRKVTNPIRILSLISLFCLFGILVPIHPSPLCAITKAFTRYQIRGFVPPAMIVMGGAMIILTVTGNKIFCGWICPLGCMQEVVLKFSGRIKKFKAPFAVTNWIRLLLFISFLTIVSIFRINIYDFFNPFELFHWHPRLYTLLIITIVLLVSLVYYRPFCAFICPVGLLTWIFEQISVFKIHKNEVLCTHCNKCIKEGPCNAIGDIIADQKVTPDCFACGKCIESCPEEALSFSLKKP